MGYFILYQAVNEFQQAFGLFVADKPSLPPQDLRDLRIRLLAEEVREYHEADQEWDLVEVADALVDIAYIVCGTALTYGIAPDGPFSLPYSDDIGLPAFPNENMRHDCSTRLTNLFEEYLAAEKENDFSAISDTLETIIYTVGDIAWVFGFKFAPLFAEVHRSNMAKLDENGRPIYREDGKVKKPEGWTPPDIKSILDAQTSS